MHPNRKRPPQQRTATTARRKPLPGPGRPRVAIDEYVLEKMLAEGRSLKTIADHFGCGVTTLNRRIAEIRSTRGDAWGRRDPSIEKPAPVIARKLTDTPEQLEAQARYTLSWAMTYGCERDLGAAVRAATYVLDHATPADTSDATDVQDAIAAVQLAIERAGVRPAVVEDDPPAPPKRAKAALAPAADEDEALTN